MSGGTRESLLGDLERVWRQYPEHRFGQMVVQALMVSRDASADVDIAAVSDGELRAALKERWAEYSTREPFVPRGPFWDTETPDGRNFMNGLPRDPARIPRFIETLERAWGRHANLSLGHLLAKATRFRLLVGIEDGKLRRQLHALAGEPIRLWLDDDFVDRAAPEDWMQVDTAHEAIALLDTGQVVELSLDHDLGNEKVSGRGIDVVDWLAEQQEVHDRPLWPRDGMTIHSANPAGRDAMAREIERYAGKRLRVYRSLTAGGKPRFTFSEPGSCAGAP